MLKGKVILHVVGNAYKTEVETSWATSSDLRLKKILGKYSKGLNEIIELQPFTHVYKINNPRKLDTTSIQVGFVAQEVQKIFSESVKEAKDGYLDFNIHSINVALVNAIKELNEKVNLLETENIRLKVEIEQLKNIDEQMNHRIANLEKFIGTNTLK